MPSIRTPLERPPVPRYGGGHLCRSSSHYSCEAHGFKVDQAFSKKYGVPVAAPFQLTAPTDESYKMIAQAAPKPGNAIIKVNYGTHDNKFLENVQAISTTIRMVDPEQRLKITAKLISEQVFLAMVRGHQNAKKLGLRKLKIGPYVAAELIGSYVTKEFGPMYIRIVGILNPKGPASILTVANIVAAHVTIKTANGFVEKIKSGGAMTTFRYLE